MTDQTQQAGQTLQLEATANDRFKRSYASWFWGSITMAVGLHFVLFAFTPDFAADDVSMTPDVVQVENVTPKVEIPPPPQAPRRPAEPVISTAPIDPDITMEITTSSDWEDTPLPPPPEEVDTEATSNAIHFVVTEVRPKPIDVEAVQRAMEREYPPLLKDAGIEGTTVLYLYVNTDGTIGEARVGESAGHVGLDEAALKLVNYLKFSPAYNRDTPIAVWTKLPLTWTAK